MSVSNPQEYTHKKTNPFLVLTKLSRAIWSIHLNYVGCVLKTSPERLSILERIFQKDKQLRQI